MSRLPPPTEEQVNELCSELSILWNEASNTIRKMGCFIEVNNGNCPLVWTKLQGTGYTICCRVENSNDEYVPIAESKVPVKILMVKHLSDLLSECRVTSKVLARSLEDAIKELKFILDDQFE